MFNSSTTQDGVLDAWDILYQQKAPILSTKVSDESVNCIKVREGDTSITCISREWCVALLQIHEQGCLVGVGCNNGNTSLLELSDSLSVCHR